MGRGVDANHRLSLALFKRAADLGDPEAHGQMGLRYATGLAGPESVEGGAIKHFDAVRF
jgi:TPR repeat protein